MRLSLLICSVLFPLISNASNYPPDYCDQNVRIRKEGPAVFVNVSSGCFSASVFGYKSTGSLAASNPEKIQAVVTTQCKSRDGLTMTRQKVVQLGREWHGTGYMSAPMSPYEFYIDRCGESVFEVAFSDGEGHWDSKGGANYRLRDLNFDDSSIYRTHQSGREINLKAWDFIVEEMRN